MDADDLRERIRRRAYELWDREGQPEGRALNHWLHAEAEIAAAGVKLVGEAAQVGQRTSQRGSMVLINLLSLVVLFAAVVAYFFSFTDAGPFLATLFTLSGAFAWLAFLAGLLSDTVKDQMRNVFERWVLAPRWASSFMLGIGLILFFAYPARHGTIVLDGAAADNTQTVLISRLAGNAPSQDEPWRVVLPARGRTQVSVPTNGFFGLATYTVKVSGMPNMSVHVSSLRRTPPVALPDVLFTQPVILIRPSANIIPAAISGDYHLAVILDDEQLETLGDYTGQAVWLGTDDDVEPPGYLVHAWSYELTVAGFKDYLGLWLRPLTVAAQTQLAPGSSIAVKLLDSETGELFASGEAVVRLPQAVADFPQEVIIDRPTR